MIHVSVKCPLWSCDPSAACAGPGGGVGVGAVQPAGGAVQPGAAENSVQRGGESLQPGEREERQHWARSAAVRRSADRTWTCAVSRVSMLLLSYICVTALVTQYFKDFVQVKPCAAVIMWNVCDKPSVCWENSPSPSYLRRVTGENNTNNSC